MNILGISAFYHDAAAALLRDGRIIAAAQEERFSRKKHDERFPAHAIDYCLHEGGITASALDAVVFYDKPFTKFNRLLETYLHFAPRGFRSFIMAMPVWLKDKLWIPDTIETSLDYNGKILYAEHHESHAASAFFPSPFDRAAFLTIDGVGEYATSSFGTGRDNHVQIIAEQHFPHSVGLLYSAFTYFTGFRVNSGEYKVMGLAPYGEPKYVQKIFDHLIDLKDDGSFHMNMDYFDYATGLRMTNDRFASLFGGPARAPESNLTQREMDLARSVQDVTEEIMLRMARHVKKTTGENNLCLAGGVALNCVANGKLLRERIFDRIWIQPAAGDAGGAIGAAYIGYHHAFNHPVIEKNGRDAQHGSYFGPAYADTDVKKFIDAHRLPYQDAGTIETLCARTAKLLAEGNVVGWHEGRMEFGPRALGSRSILGDPRNADMQKRMNLKIKFRESFRPFAPAVLAEDVADWFELGEESPYMLLVADVKKERRRTMTEEEMKLWGISKLNVVRSEIPAVTHVDYSARVQTVHPSDNPVFHLLIEEFKKITGCSVLVNTSFNVRGEPIVESPEDAYRCFMRTDMDVLVMGRYLLYKKDQPALTEAGDWKKEYELD
ncbi:MAG TPA: carbamoyltransferase [Bacteroidota bacterium]|nr:carbamoyltransferase [Bacteroidota bacterium]